MTLLLLTACLAPTTVGLHTDGWVGPPGSVDVAAGYGSTLPALDTRGGEQLGLGGATVGVVPAERVRVWAGAGFPTNLLTTELGAHVRVVGDETDPLSVSLLGGVSALWSRPSFDNGGVGIGGGAVVAYEALPDLRPYVGARLDPQFGGDDVPLFVDVSAGATWRPRLADRVSLLLLAEATWLHADSQGGDLDYDVLVGAGMVGLTLETGPR